MNANLPDLPDVCPMPLEKAVAELITKNAKYGDFISKEWLARNLKLEVASTRFKNRMSKLTRLLGPLGFRLSTVGQQGKGYRVLGKMEAVDFVANRERRRADQTLADALMLGAIDGGDLSPSDQAKLEHSQTKAMTIYMNTIGILNQKSLPHIKAVEPPPSLKAPEALKTAQEISKRDTA